MRFGKLSWNLKAQPMFNTMTNIRSTLVKTQILQRVPSVVHVSEAMKF